MTYTFTIHKPTHRFLDRDRKVLAVGQMRGDLLYLNRLDNNGAVIEKTRSVGSCTYALTGYGTGVSPESGPRYASALANAWAFMFGRDEAFPAYVEQVEA